MDACLAVDREVDKVLSKFGQIRENVDNVLQQLIDSLENIKCDLLSKKSEDALESNKTSVVLVKGFLDKCKKDTHKLATEHRELHSTVSKVGKAIDRNFISDFAATSREDIFSGPTKTDLVNRIICQHFYRQGMWDIADELSEESGIEVECGQREPFAKLNTIVESLKKKDICPALEWARENRSQLEIQSSSLEFKLHRLAFLTLIQKGVEHQTKAVAYARANFGQFVEKHEKEVQTLMGMLLYVPQGIEESPYSYMVETNMWTEVNELFTRDACMMLGLSVESLLNVSINAGCMALPALLNIKQVMQQRQVTGIWSGKDELPIEIDLDPEHRYHSMFACPILRQQSSDTNPPMRLICGHVISKDALHKLGNSNKLKCPYCPMEQNPSEAKLICF
ncbi:E3 ubiquitin-protein ligase RMND5A-like isoform X2 [Adelges cooleyi]|uniref:E3 ubiquitin-protein ligase RMND5A-like isoform X2 n=1 Tax=Adelges cooleyi TaxID=133065 RepID=UPI00217F8ED0|nr:E3 ubiquitin-protein ligase RMND5A-like isoform X2 [Adelges cooleyi]